MDEDAARRRGARRLRRARGARQGRVRLAAHDAAQPAARAGARRRHHRRARRPHPRQAGEPRRGGGDARRALRPRHEVLTAVALKHERLAGERAVGLRGRVQEAVRRRRSGSTSPAANATTRPAPTRSRAAPRASSSSCAAATPASWACRCTKPASCSTSCLAALTRSPMNEEILINVTPQETRVAVVGAGAVQELLIERAASRGLVGNIYIGQRGARAARACSRRSSRSAWRAPRSCTSPTSGNERERAPSRSRRSSPKASRCWCRWSRTRSAPRARASRRRSRSPAACSSTCRTTRTSASRSASRTKAAAQALRERLRELLPADEKGGFIVRTLAETAGEDELRADIDYLRQLWRAIRERSRGCAGASKPQLLYQDLSLAQRVLRDMASAGTVRVVIDSRENFQKLAAFAESYMPKVRAKHRALHRRAAAVRPVQRRDRDRARAVAPRRAQVGRHAGHRPDRGDDHHRRQHRRLRRQPQLRRHRVQDQPRGGAGDRAPAAPAQPRRHHHRRLHRHGDRRSTAPPCSRNSSARSRATARA